VVFHFLLLIAPACVDLSPPPSLTDGGAGADAPALFDAPDDPGDDTLELVGGDAPTDTWSGDVVHPDAPVTDGGSEPVPPTTLADGLVGYWKLDDRSSALVEDSSGMGNDGTVQGAPSLLAGAGVLPPAITFDDPGAYSFVAMNDAVVVPDTASLRPANITVAVWVKLASQSARGTNCGAADPMLQYIVHRRNMRGSEGNFEGVALMKEAQGTFAFLLTTNSGQQGFARSQTLATTDQWFHLVGTFDGGVIQLYVNGMLEGSKTHFNPIDYDPTRPLYIARTGECAPSGEGDATWDARFNGALDDLRVYDRVLTVDEVTRLAAGRNE
jgi:hypothetical protein